MAFMEITIPLTGGITRDGSKGRKMLQWQHIGGTQGLHPAATTGGGIPIGILEEHGVKNGHDMS